MERSPQFTFMTFVQNLTNEKKLTECEYNTLSHMYNQTNALWSPDLYIYLHQNPDINIERIKQRGRNFEKNIDDSYITNLHELHNEAYNELLKKENVKIIKVEINNMSAKEITDIVYNHIRENFKNIIDKK